MACTFCGSDTAPPSQGWVKLETSSNLLYAGGSPAFCGGVSDPVANFACRTLPAAISSNCGICGGCANYSASNGVYSCLTAGCGACAGVPEPFALKKFCGPPSFLKLAVIQLPMLTLSIITAALYVSIFLKKTRRLAGLALGFLIPIAHS